MKVLKKISWAAVLCCPLLLGCSEPRLVCDLPFKEGVIKRLVAPTLSYFDMAGEPALDILGDEDIESVRTLIEKTTGLPITLSAELAIRNSIVIVETCRVKRDGCRNYYGNNFCKKGEYKLFYPDIDAYRNRIKCNRIIHAFPHTDGIYHVGENMGAYIKGEMRDFNGFERLSVAFVFPSIGRRLVSDRKMSERNVDGQMFLKSKYNDQGKTHTFPEISTTLCYVTFDLELAEKKRLVSECLIRSFGLFEHSPNSTGYLSPNIKKTPKNKYFFTPEPMVKACLSHLYEQKEGT
ncbi:MAG: hypothetical protein COA43_15100 [Robiginitomaculum sp.]|nr:MAG: hypothetical protein COA43_15100 [Robiginitomaculum sp.]